MSRFFGKSDSETETSESEDEIQVKPPAKTFIALSDDDEETRRVVKSTKDKKFEELQTIITNLKNHKKIKDMSNVLTGNFYRLHLKDFEDLGKAFEKAKKIIEKEGIPRFFIRSLVELEGFVNQHWDDAEGRKLLSKANSKGLTALRQKLKKYNKNFEDKLANYRENPDVVGSEDEKSKGYNIYDSSDEEKNDDDDEIIAPPSKGKQTVADEKAKNEESDSDDMWEQESSSESSSSDEDIRPLNQLTADYFRKKVPLEGEVERKKKEKDEKKKKAKVKIEEESDDEVGEWEKVKPSAAVVERPEIFGKDVEITHDVVRKKLSELVAGRGKKGTDRSMQIDLLIDLRKIAKDHNLGEPLDCKILFCIIASIFDYNPSVAASMKVDMWEKCLFYIKELLKILNDNIGVIIVGEYIGDDAENVIGPNPPYKLRGCMLTTVERMDEEFTLMLQACDAHSTEYIERLRDETTVCKIIEDLERYLKGHSTDDELCRVFLKRIQHLYYKFDPKSFGTGPETLSDPNSSRAVMDRLCKFIYAKDTTDRIRTRAILSHIYHHALHDRFFEARDLMLMSHLQDNIQHSDIPTQILYNRAMVQLGLCAFRQGMIKDAHNCLVDIQSSRRARELLAQGLLPQRQHERTPEQEKKEKRRQIPYHMHINLELLECVYLVSAMLIEIPNMAAHEFDARKRMISKNFHHVLRENEKQTLVGPPENMREHVVAACKAMKSGDWKACYNYIVNEKMNAKVWDLFANSDDVRKMIGLKIQEESLRTYLFSYSYIYESLSLDNLSHMFNLPSSTIHSIVSKMVINDELLAAIDEPSQTVVMHKTEPSLVQSLALQLADKLSQIVEHNERSLDLKITGPSYFNYQPRPQYGAQNAGSYQQRDGQQQNYIGRRQNQRGRDGGVRFQNQ
ncbi:hypothetical protein HELRODRAFT_109647 [Helobdella robusta]|uniref:Eukaryotic translation initiation factor 3 subunit C n=1 Tax=Helobdella robusta TaxID=6412 RepID=T1EEV4_HELRO|nr:hypothetical protein HELRODRAFT_109647 [Helobdella robusta]ESO09399.1 hypothetical protein HELRODRAFT_109647 [Helobdella robusta]